MVSNMENLNPQVIRHVGKEVHGLSSEPLEGIHLLVNERDLTDVQAVIDGPEQTPYAGGKFRVKLAIGKDFPASPPKGFFLTKIFHPNVSSSGEICVNTLKKDWKADLGIRHILLTIKCLLIVPNPESALNEEAGKLLLERYDDYCARARLYTDIHAKMACSAGGVGTSGSASGSSGESDGDAGKRSGGAASSAAGVVGGAPVSAADKKALSKKEKTLKDKKKMLKRL